jgi:hypothetical protein
MIDEERQLICKMTGEVGPELMADNVHRVELMDRWKSLVRTADGGNPTPPK